jgi:hydroxyethylthiazole kinase-like uncharacterized protein yjeF
MPRRILAQPWIPAGNAAGASTLGLFDATTARAVEASALAALPDYTLMHRAGGAVAALARAVKPHARKILVLTGPGNNGGDGYEAALQLHQAGYAVTVVGHGDEARLPVDARTALTRARQGGVVVHVAGNLPNTLPTSSPGSLPGTGSSTWPGSPAWDAAAELGADDLVIDALLGRGLSRAVTGDLAAVIRQINELALDVLAVDLPSGLPSDTGWLAGSAISPCVRARWTLALLTMAPGLWTAQGRDQAGEIWFDDLGVADPGLPPLARLTLGPAQPAAREHSSNKGSFGDVWVIGGASGMTGAVALAARAALQAGAGRVYQQPLGTDAPSFDAQAPELMVRHVRLPSTTAETTTGKSSGTGKGSGGDSGPSRSLDSGLGIDFGATSPVNDVPGETTPASPSVRELSTATVVAGCGGGAAIAARLPELIEHSHRLVLDADALNAIAASSELQQALRHRSARGLATVLTPHPLEAARLLGCSAAEVQADRLAAARALIERLGCAVVVKGSGSVVMAPGLTPHINPSGNAALSTPGSGDVLAGWLAGWWSQTGRSNDRGLAAPEATPLSSSLPSAAPDAAVVAEPSEPPTDTPAWATDTMAAASYAVWSHGRAAELASPRGLALPAGELVTALGSGLRAGLF